MPVQRFTQEILIDAGGGTVDLPVTDNYQYYYIDASAGVVLVGSWVIQADGTPEEFMQYLFKFKGAITLGANTFTVFGQAIPERLLNANTLIECYYNGSDWEVTTTSSLTDTGIISDGNLAADSVVTSKIDDLAVTTAKINDLAVSTAKVADSAITSAKLASGIGSFPRTYAGSFETGEQATIRTLFYDSYTVLHYTYTVTKALSATDAGVITINTTSGTALVINIPLSSAINTSVSGDITLNNTLVAGEYLDVIFSKATVGGKVDLLLWVEPS